MLRPFLLALSFLILQSRPSFEVTSIKPHALTDRMVIGGQCHATDSPPSRLPMPPLGRCSMKTVTLKRLINTAYNLQLGASNLDEWIVGGPTWAGTETYDIEAKAENPNTTREQFFLMFQSLLADRFKLQFHKEQKEVSTLVLVVAKNGLKMKKSDGTEARMLGTRGESGPATGMRVNMALFANFLAGRLGRTVVDKTRLTGEYNFSLTWSADESERNPGGGAINPAAVVPGGPSLLTAIQEQLGLRVETQKVSVDVVVIDSATKPTLD